MFQRDFLKVFGKAPYFNPEGQFKIDWLPKITTEMHEHGSKKMSIFQSWFKENLVGPTEDGISEALLIVPWTTGTHEYCDVYRTQQDWIGYGCQYYLISLLTHASVPIGQTPFISKVMKLEEWLLVSLGVIEARGSDVSSSGLLQDFMRAIIQLPTTVDIGEMSFPVQSPSIVNQTPLHGLLFTAS